MSNNQTADSMNEALNTAGKITSPAEMREQADRLRKTADVLEAQLQEEQRRNDSQEAGPSGMASKLRDQRKPSTFKTVRKVLGWTLGVGCVGLVGAYAYSKLRDIGADDVADAVVGAADRVADKVDAAVSAAAAA